MTQENVSIEVTEEATGEDAGRKPLLRIDESKLKRWVDGQVKNAVEDVLNDIMESEAKALAGAEKHERTTGRKDYRNGYRKRKLQTRVGEVDLKVPRLRSVPFTTAAIERYRRRESSIEEALVEMYIAGVSTRRVSDVTEALFGASVSSSAMSELNKKVYDRLDEWRSRPLGKKYPYVYLDGMVMSRRWTGEVSHFSVLVAVGVGEDGVREVIGIADGAKEDKASWLAFLRHLKERGLCGVKLVVSDACLGLVASLEEVFPQARWQRCSVHFYRNVLAKVPLTHKRYFATALKAIHAQESRDAAMSKVEALKTEWGNRFAGAVKILTEGVTSTLTYYDFPPEHWRRIRTNNPMERLLKEVRRRTNVVGSFPDGKSALMLATARVRYVSERTWSGRRYMDVSMLLDLDKQPEEEPAA
jgi:putative transposase